MALLGAAHYDPSTLATKATSSLLAMTAIDTTNLRLTFNAPSNGTVLVRMRCGIRGATSSPAILLGVLDGSTVRGRQAPITGKLLNTANNILVCEAAFLVNGLTSGNSYTFDAAYGVETVVASSSIHYGGPNNATQNDAFGGFTYEIWETTDLLAGKHYDPSTAVSKSIASALAMTAFDTTNLRLTFTSPSSQDVLVRIRCVSSDATVAGGIMLGVLDGSTVIGRQVPIGGASTIQAPAADSQVCWEAQFPCMNIGSGSKTWDAAYGVEFTAASGNIKYGGPNNTTTDDAWGGITFEVWEL